MNLSNLVRAAVFSAAAVALGFMFILIPNVEFISITVFLSGMTLGLPWGIGVGASSMLIYSTFNPLGSGLIYFTLLLSQVIAMSFIGILGSISIKIIKNLSSTYQGIFAGFLGFFGTLIYNIFTSLAYPLSAGYSLKEVIVYCVSGILFTGTHLISNTAIFLLVVPGFLRKVKLSA
tara:strand:+ start:1582 stop:2109 length:528 start_codon:yes stop_codon:yes gene_type:complete